MRRLDFYFNLVILVFIYWTSTGYGWPPCIPPAEEPYDLTSTITVDHPGGTYDIRASGPEFIFDVTLDPTTGEMKLSQGDDVIATYNNIEFDWTPAISGNMSWSTTNHTFKIRASIEGEAKNYFIADDPPPNDPPSPPMEKAIRGAASLRKCFLPRVLLQIQAYPSQETQRSFDFGPSIPFPGASFQFFWGRSITSTTGGGFFVQGALEVDPRKILSEYKEEIAYISDNAVRVGLNDIITKMEEMARTAFTPWSAPAVGAEYIKALHPVMAPAIAALDKFTVLQMVRNIPSSTYFKTLYPDQPTKKDQRTGKTRETELIVRGEAAAAAADEVMKTFICRFSRTILESVANNYSFYRDPYQKLIARYMHGCYALRKAFRSNRSNPFPYIPETVNGSDMIELLARREGEKKSNQGAALYYFLAEMKRQGGPLYDNDGNIVPGGDWDALIAANSKFRDRETSLKFINRLATDPSIASVMLRESGILFESEWKKWRDGNLSDAFLKEITIRYAQGTRDELHGAQLDRFDLWLRWVTPYRTGKEVIRAELAHRFLDQKDLSWPGEYWLIDPSDILNRDDYDKMYEYKAAPARLAVRDCLMRGMALAGAGERGESILKEEYPPTTAPHEDPRSFYKGKCKVPIWAEPSTSDRWNRRKLPFRSLTSHVFKSDFSTDPWTWEVAPIWKPHGWVCVAGTKTPRPPVPTGEVIP